VLASLLMACRTALMHAWAGPTDLPRPLKLERRLVMGRWVGIVVFALALAVHPIGSEQLFGGYVVLLIASGYNLTLHELLRQRRTGFLVSTLPTVGDGLLCAAMLALVGGFDSPFYTVLFAVAVSGGMRLGLGRGVVLVVAVTLFEAIWRAANGTSMAETGVVVRTGMLFLTVLLTSFLFEESKKTETELSARLHQSEVLNSALEYQARHDLLTDLPNRTLLHASVQEAIDQAGKASVALLVIDLDRFKEINDTFGHQHGDGLLQEIGPRLRDVLEPGTIIARLGGDEFAVLLPDSNSLHAEQVARNVLAALDQPFSISDNLVEVCGSIGIALSPEHGTNSDALLRRADVAMYVAKRNGRGVAIYAPEQDQHSPDRLTLVGDLRRAIDGGGLQLVYQPKVSLQSGRIVGVEALIRWNHPQRGPVPPDQFIPLAEQTGLIRNLSRWVLDAALRQARLWQHEGINVPIAVNLSMRDLHDVELPEQVFGLLDQWGVRPNALVVEITENGLMAEPTRALQTITGLRAMGIRIAIDDFGTGYSSLAYLKNLPVDELKIDRSFVRELVTDEHDLAIVRSTISLGHDLGLSIVAEGIEDGATWTLLQHLGCDVAQGYYSGRPMTAAAVVEQIHSRELAAAA
jgi:diguanylate cyclase (GGDEF)-like protein